MKHGAWKWILVGGALTVIVLFGIEMSTTGIERIYGPMDGSLETGQTGFTAGIIEQSNHASETERRIEELERELERIRELAGDEDKPEKDWLREKLMNQEEETPVVDDQPAVDKIADSTSGLLKTASTSGIKLVANLFDGLIN